MQLLNGKEAAQAIKDSLKLTVAQLSAQGKEVPHLVAILVGTNGASETYVLPRSKPAKKLVTDQL